MPDEKVLSFVKIKTGMLNVQAMPLKPQKGYLARSALELEK